MYSTVVRWPQHRVTANLHFGNMLQLLRALLQVVSQHMRHLFSGQVDSLCCSYFHSMTRLRLTWYRACGHSCAHWLKLPVTLAVPAGSWCLLSSLRLQLEGA